MKFQFEEDYSFEARKKLAEDQAKGPDNLMPVIFQRLQTGDYKGTTYHQMMLYAWSAFNWISAAGKHSTRRGRVSYD